MDEFVEETYFQKNQEAILKRAKDYHENDKKRLREQARDKYRSLSQEEKKSKESKIKKKKQELKEYQKN